MKKPYRETQKFAEGGSTRKPGIPLPSDRATGYRSQVAETGMSPEERRDKMRDFAAMLAVGSGPGLISALALPAKGVRAARAVEAAKTAGKPLAEKTAAKVAAKADKPPVDLKLYERALKNASRKGYGTENFEIVAKEYENLWKMKEGMKQFRQNSARLARESKPEGMRSGGMVKSGLDGCAIRGKTNGSNR